MINRAEGASNQTILRLLVWASLVSQIVIVITGGAVRLTGSGLGCPTWPTCTESSLITVPEMGIHGVIEFTNRMLTFVLLAIAALTVIQAIRVKQVRTRNTALLLIIGIILQAVIGGISVLFQLNPWIVGLHFLVSAVMIIIASIQLWNAYLPKISTTSALEMRLFSFFGGASAITVLIGVLVTGSGPHAGDSETPRNGLDPELWQHFHSYPGYVSLALSVALLIIARRRDVDGYASRLAFWVTVTLIAQAALGVMQARLGLPIWMVLGHLSLASVLVALITLQSRALARNT